MTKYVLFNGYFIESTEPCLRATDRGFMLGDGLFETLRAYNRQLPFWNLHIERLISGMSQLGFPLASIPFKKMKNLISELLARNLLSNAYLRLTISRGDAVSDFLPKWDHGESNWVAFTKPLPSQLELNQKKGIKAGCYANFPSGETFVTPETVKGIFVGDVVINIDQSYVIPENNPLIIEIKKNKYRVIAGPKNMVQKMKKEKAEAMQKIRNYEINKSLPSSITKMYRQNFNSIGEFAVNLNPKAKLCNYLIVNEKIARMIHLALGMGFEPDRKTVYHWDIVVNSPKQKLDIYGIGKKKKIHWVIKKGKFVV